MNSVKTLTSFTGCFFQDLLGRTLRKQELSSHLLAAQHWLKRAHDMTADDGVSYGYSLRGGWRPSYPETSGYIVETFFQLGDHDSRERAIRIARWLTTIQNRDGSYANPNFHPHQGIVFDTGQILFGLGRAFRETQDECILEAAKKAGMWLINVMDPDGAWRHNTYLQTVHTYNSRVAWALLELKMPEFEQAARKNLDWVLQQEKDGWLDHCAFNNEKPYTHTIAYAIRGLLESAILLEESRYLDAATRVTENIFQKMRQDGFISGQVNRRYCCLTGNCQLSIICFKLYQVIGNRKYLEWGQRALDFVMERQNLHTQNPNIRGGIKGSHPIWGRYAPFTYPNWAVKFFIDALLLRMELEK